MYWGRRVEYEGALLRHPQLADVPEPHLLMGHQQPAFDNDDDEDYLMISKSALDKLLRVIISMIKGFKYSHISTRMMIKGPSECSFKLIMAVEEKGMEGYGG